MSACGVTVDRCSAGTLSGRFRLSPGLHLGITGDNLGSAGASPELTVASPRLTGTLPGC
ncbi:hypothetical protein DPMN_180363 [Dreissena polymorpha]|uniref:Uncharacterized protein n=1 Tax=Dreissena polymorpha TaxID=45954 RepID=A0A9D4EHZ7_DREPO|nr:hypothetical protein DPMN_180363 [Dreissena polymorpha]